MITIISGTNRPNSRTSLISSYYLSVLDKLKIENLVYDLQNLSSSFYHPNMYNGDYMPADLVEVQEKFILPADKMIFIVPEYNGTFPGILKVFMDVLLARKYKENFSGKKICLVGVSSGKAGCLRGLEGLTGALNYLGATVFPLKLLISSIETLIKEDVLVHQETQKAIESQLMGFIKF